MENFLYKTGKAVKRDADFYKQLAREKLERNSGRRNFQANYQRLVLEELEALKNRLLREAKMEQKKYSLAS